MPDKSSNVYDILIAGSGFAGSLTAILLHQKGFKVCLVEKDQHPRFAIGESSTPIADMILRDLARQYDLPWLYDFSRYGSWKKAHPEIACGLKRGFSYFKHFPGQSFFTDSGHSNELLVAASPNNDQSDTNWFRSDFDAYLVEQVKGYGITYLDNTTLQNIEEKRNLIFTANRKKETFKIHTQFFIDATGNSGLLSKLFGVDTSVRDLITNSFAIYSHFDDLPYWSDYLQKSGFPTGDYPYNPDHSALHQILDDGWMWMLRFNNGRTSAGIMMNSKTNQDNEAIYPKKKWENIINMYPSLTNLFQKASIAREPGKIIQTGRVQRKMEKARGNRWVALPNTVGFVDPLHSTGIAHSLHGIEKITRSLVINWHNSERLEEFLIHYEASVFKELRVIDKLVAGCYQTFSRFDLFNYWSMVYFIIAISYEQKRLNNNPPDCFLLADDPHMLGLINDCYNDLNILLNKNILETKDITWFREKVYARIQPYNIAGLLDPNNNNMYKHTAIEF